MTAAADIASAATLCLNAANAATTTLIAMGPCPAAPTAAAAWHDQDTALKTNISDLNNLSATLSAVAVTDALNGLWQDLAGLNAAVSSVQSDIATIADISNVMTKLSTIINFAVAVAAVAAAPTPAGVESVVTAFTAMTGS